MRLYQMELTKLIGRRFTQIMTGLLFTVQALQLWVESKLAVQWAASGLDDFGQYFGYKRFLELSQYFVLYAMIWLTVVLSSFYCEDRQSRTNVLILTSVKGKLADFAARLAASYTLAVGVMVFVLAAACGGCGMLYGYYDGGAPAETIYLGMGETASALAAGSIYAFTGYYLIRVLCGVLMLTGIIVWVSAVSSKAMYALITVSAIFWCPVMLESGLPPGGIGYVLLTGQPLWFSAVHCMHENWPLYRWYILLAVLTAIVGSICGGRRWCRLSGQ